jgi:hypothetical protein
MTSRQRLLAALRRAPVDRLPVSLYELHRFGGCWAADEPSYAPLLDLQDARGDAFVFAPSPPGLLGDPNAVRTGVELSVRDGEVTRTFSTPKGPLTSVTRTNPGTVTTWTMKRFIEDEEDIARFLSLPCPFTPPAEDEVRALLTSAGENGLVVFSIGDPLGVIEGLCDFAFFVTRIAPDAALVGELLDRAARFLADTVDWINARFTDVGVRFWGPEYCGAPLMDPGRYFRPLVMDRLVPLVKRVQSGGNLALVHCHGRLDALLGMIAETGADALEPLEVLPVVTADVTMAEVARRLRGRMCLAGGLQAVDLETGTPTLMRERVRSLRDAAGDVGLILLPTSAPLDVPLPARTVENYRAVFEAAGR